MSYQNVDSNQFSSLQVNLESSSDQVGTRAPAATFIKISKEQLFGGLLPPTLFESSSLMHTSGGDLNQQSMSAQFGTNCL
jgi:hypothetical protein